MLVGSLGCLLPNYYYLFCATKDREGYKYGFSKWYFYSVTMIKPNRSKKRLLSFSDVN